MKKILSLIAIFFSLTAFGQSLVTGQTVSIITGTGSYFQWYQTSAPRVSSTDSVQLLALALTNQSVTGITWSQDAIGGPAVTLPAATSQTSPGVAASSAFWLSNLAPGPYRFTATAKLSSGAIYTTKDSIYVVSAPVPRTLTSLQVDMFGVWLPVPVTTATVKAVFSDGGTQ